MLKPINDKTVTCTESNLSYDLMVHNKITPESKNAQSNNENANENMIPYETESDTPIPLTTTELKSLSF